MLWNDRYLPISSRMQDQEELLKILEGNSLIYNPKLNQTAVILEVYIMDDVQDENDIHDLTDELENRYVVCLWENQIIKGFSIEIDDDGWIWAEEVSKTKSEAVVDGPKQAAVMIGENNTGGSQT